MGWKLAPLGMLLVLTGLWGIPVQGQALFYSPRPDATLLKAQSAQLASDAIRLVQLGRAVEALNRARLAVQLDPTSPELWLILGSLHLENRNYPDAVSTLEQARQRDGNNPSILFTLGEAYMRTQQYVQAVEALEAGLALRRDDP
ncbi:MAG: tetratricopeptide repeat protein, partial [Thermostichales cyanobacterium BF4_bins_65]